jgi:hypothetical protein
LATQAAGTAASHRRTDSVHDGGACLLQEPTATGKFAHLAGEQCRGGDHAHKTKGADMAPSSMFADQCGFIASSPLPPPLSP